MTSARRTAAVFGCAFVLAVLTAVVATPRARAACDPAPSSEQGYVDASDVAFDGLVVAKTAGDPNNTWTFRVDNKVKGNPPAQQDVQSPKDSNGVQFTVGTSYRVYAKKQADGSLLTTICSGDHTTGESPPLSSSTTAVRTATTSVSTATTSRSVTSTVSTLPPPTTAATFVLSPTTGVPFTTSAGGNNVAIKEEKPARTNRLVIGLILGAAVVAIGAGVVLWRRGP